LTPRFPGYRVEHACRNREIKYNSIFIEIFSHCISTILTYEYNINIT
jgi:hypothetical protein